MKVFGFTKGVVLAAIATMAVGGASQAINLGQGLELHGYTQNRGYDGQSASEYKLERVSLSAKLGMTSSSYTYVESYYYDWATTNDYYIESAYYDAPVGKGRLRLGKGRNLTFGITPAFSNRKTSNYGIVSEAFTQDRIQGAQYLLQSGKLDFGASLHYVPRLGTRSTGSISGDTSYNSGNTVKHLCSRELIGDLSRELELTTRVGTKLPNGIKGGISFALGRTDDKDLANLSTSSASNPLTPGATPALVASSDINKLRMIGGADFTYKHPKGYLAQCELFDANVSGLGYDGWSALVGWDAPKGWRFYARYGGQDMRTPVTANPLSWDQKQLSLSAVEPLHTGIWLQYEYEMNFENSNTGANVDDNVGFAELYLSF